MEEAKLKGNFCEEDPGRPGHGKNPGDSDGVKK